MDGGLIVGSSDVQSFYPVMDIDVVSEEAKQEIIESEVEMEGVNFEEVSLFLACSMTQEQIDKEGLTNVVHQRRNVKGARPGLTCKAVSGGPVVRGKDECWLPPGRRPGVRQKRKIIGCLVKAATRLVMKNHYYSFNNVIRKQKKGGAIGNSVTEKLGRLIMKRWGKKFSALLIKLKITLELLKSYVDDVTKIAIALDPGVRFDKTKMKMVKMEELVESDKDIPEDVRTMNELRKIANTVFECVQFTTDCPSNHVEGKVPILDLQL